MTGPTTAAKMLHIYTGFCDMNYYYPWTKLTENLNIKEQPGTTTRLILLSSEQLHWGSQCLVLFGTLMILVEERKCGS